MANKRIVVMISGGGTNLQALIDAQKAGLLPGEIVRVVSNRKSAHGLVRAEKAGIATLYMALKPYLRTDKTREDYDRDLAAKVAEARPDLIVLAGWMHIVAPVFLDAFPGRVINLHPALPGMFPGINAIERAYEAWTRGEITESGCMVHYVVPEVDAGPVIDTAVVPFEAGDTLENYAARLHTAEHQLIVSSTRKALEKVVSD